MAFSNITGTSEVHFRITLGGPTIYQGTTDPTITLVTSLDGLPLNPGDLYIRTGGVSDGLYTLGSGGNFDWDKMLVAGGPITVGGDLTVGGTIDQSGPIIILNSGGAGIPATGAGMEIDRTSGLGENVRWIWDDANQRWAATNDGAFGTLNNVYVENNLRVDGSLRVPTGSVVTPSVYFGADVNTGIFLPGAGQIGFTSGSTERWRIDASGNFVPGLTNSYDIGGSSLLAANVYGTTHLGAFGSLVSPSFTFNAETDLGLYRPAVGTLGIAGSGGTEIARFNTTLGQVTFNNVTGTDSFVINGTGDVFLRVNTPTGGNSSGIELRGPGGAPDNWQISNDSAQSSRMDITYGGTDLVNVQTTGQIQVLDGNNLAPTYSFGSDTGIGMFSNSAGAVSIGTNNLERFRVNPNGSIEATTAFYESLVASPNILTNKQYVDNLIGVGGSSWREPVVVKDDTIYINLTAAEAVMNTGTVDGVTVIANDRILYPNITGQSSNVFIVTGNPGAGATLVEDVNTVSFGDAVYVVNGTFAGSVFAYDVANLWSEISGSGGGGGTLYYNYEVQVAGGGQTIFPLGNAYAPTPTGSRLVVYVNGVKQQGNSVAYTETNSTTVTFIVAPGAGKFVEFYSVGAATQNGILNRETQTGLVGTPVINFSSITYVLGQDGLLVYLNGQKMIVGTDYTETTTTSITWIGPVLVAPDVLEFYSSIPIVAGTDLENVDNVDGTPPTIGNDGDVLTWDNAGGQWEPQPIPAIPAGILFDELVDGVLGNGPTIFNTVNVAVSTNSPTTSYQQVFVNGILQKETASYTITGPNQITFLAAVPVGADVTIYQL